MNLKDLIYVSSWPGLYKLVASRSNGLVVSDIDTGKTRFAPTRKHQFTPLESVGIYTYTDTESLSKVFENMLKNPPSKEKMDESAYYAYFNEVLPEFDEDRVYLSDIKKLCKWYHFLNERGYLTMPSDEEE